MNDVIFTTKSTKTEWKLTINWNLSTTSHLHDKFNQKKKLQAQPNNDVLFNANDQLDDFNCNIPLIEWYAK